MSRIQNLLEKAERDGTALRTSRMATPPAHLLPCRPLPFPRRVHAGR